MLMQFHSVMKFQLIGTNEAFKISIGNWLKMKETRVELYKFVRSLFQKNVFKTEGSIWTIDSYLPRIQTRKSLLCSPTSLCCAPRHCDEDSCWLARSHTQPCSDPATCRRIRVGFPWSKRLYSHAAIVSSKSTARRDCCTPPAEGTMWNIMSFLWDHR